MNAEKIDDYDEKLDITSPNYVYTEEDWKHINEGLDDVKNGVGLEEWSVYFKRLKAEMKEFELQYNKKHKI
jgi:hypothetical protein